MEKYAVDGYVDDDFVADNNHHRERDVADDKS